MDLAAVRALVLQTQFRTLGVDVTVTPPEGVAVPTRGIWQIAPHDEGMPVGRDFQRREPRRALTLPRADVGVPPRGTVVMAAEPGASSARAWHVDGLDRTDGDFVRVIVVAV